MRAIRFAPPTLAARHLQNRDRARLRARLGSTMRHRSRRRSRRRHADMPTRRNAALPPLPPLPPQPGETARPHSASDAAAYALGHRRSIGTPSALHRRARKQRTLNAERARSRRPARRAANARAIEPPHRASRHPGLLLNAFNPWITPSSARPCSSEPSHASTIASRNKSLYGADSRAACRASTP
ncbi:hypothetical protein DPR00_08335 [Burkholderia pseudomallei]|nr:hypothetical protein DPQ97_19070 [Burkholderia pseudomallei]RAP87261.1 hypothetical protein DPR01_20550 [Burkholderia pseudomallei]RAP95307.1 hypothetical protein DPQ99_20005 [Burkholderia pseudomallei]RAQ07709.1 hypothetical protein DPQ98_17605 [Burkholderia pseudomallei]RAQ19698.1 hypothetical protein DPR00_08335 [Burkholderia pseudomallei]